MSQQIIALSWSRISDYRQCRRKFKLKYIEKVANFKEDASKSPHLVRGGNVHKALEVYVIKKKAGETDIKPSSLPEVENTKPLIDNIMQHYDLHPELQLAIDKDFNRVDWFSKEAWFRVIMDLIGFGKNLFIGDYKTGKFADYSGTMEEPGQLHMSSLVGMALWPNFEDVDNRYIYVDHKKTVPLQLDRSHFKQLRESLEDEHARINNETSFDADSNKYCGYCQATKDQCMYSKKAVI